MDAGHRRVPGGLPVVGETGGDAARAPTASPFPAPIRGTIAINSTRS